MDHDDGRTSDSAEVPEVSTVPGPAAWSQTELFPDLSPAPQADLGYRVSTAVQAAGITYRQLDYWARTDLVVPTIRGAAGSGSARLYSFRDIVVLTVVKKLLDAGVSLQNVRAAVDHLRKRGADDLANMTLVSDGGTIYECTSADEVYDLLRGGQAVLQVVPVSRTLAEVQGTLAHLPGERAEEHDESATDELAARRKRRKAV